MEKLVTLIAVARPKKTSKTVSNQHKVFQKGSKFPSFQVVRSNNCKALGTPRNMPKKATYSRNAWAVLSRSE